MLPTVRRMVASSVAAPPGASAAISASTAAVAAVAAAGAGATTPAGGINYGGSYRSFPLEFRLNQQQQRRYSSSKPSSPDNGSKTLPGGGSNSGGSTTTSTGSSVSSSSSPASSPDSSSTSVNASPSANTSSSTATQSAKRKRKAKEARVTGVTDVPTAAIQKLPSVPSTQHLPIETIALSAFFSQHRPMSITHSLPKLVSDDAFASIFAPRARSNNRLGVSSNARKTSDVIRTLSRAVDELETPLSGNSLASKMTRRSKEAQQQQREIERALEQSQEEDEHEALQQLPNDPSGAVRQLTSLSGHLLPFHPPPPPVPMRIGSAEENGVTEAVSREQADHGDVDGGVEIYLGKNGSSFTAKTKGAVDASSDNMAAVSSAGSDVAGFGEQSRTTRVFKALLTIEEQTDENGHVRIVAHSPEILDDEAGTNEYHASDLSLPSLNTSVIPRSFFERMALRQLRYDDAVQRQWQHLPASQQNPRMLAISVRRQKKLKMKKKKYKKLMKRTRTLRRKLDRN